MATTTKTSFQRKGKTQIYQIVGTKPSIHNNQLLVSTGVPSLDAVLGGGVAVGTVLLIEEDKYGSYGRMLLKYQLSEGVMCGHHVFLASADVSPQQTLQELPAPLIDDPGAGSSGSAVTPSVDKGGTENLGQPQEKGGSGDMKIAWRYQHLPQVQSQAGAGSKFGHYYDLTKTMEKAQVDRVPHTLVDLTEDVCTEDAGGKAMNCQYMKVLQEVKKCIYEGGFSTSTQSQHRNILRIGIQSLGSALWGEEAGAGHHSNQKTSHDPSLCRFLYALRSLLRSAFAVCTITMPTHLFADGAFTKRVEHLCDTVVNLDAFAGSDKEKNPAFKEYHGLFHIVKLPRLNSMTCHMPDTLDLAFKLRRKKFMIEKLHLPPELSDTASRTQEDPVLPAVKPGGLTSCGTGTGKSKLDF